MRASQVDERRSRCRKPGSPCTSDWLLTLLWIAGLSASAATAALAASSSDPWRWPEPQRAFLEDGPGLLLTASERAELDSGAEAGREAFISAFLARDPVPETAGNELVEAIALRRALVAREFLGFEDARARAMFLHGAPEERVEIECGDAFKPLEIWGWGAEEDRRYYLFYRPRSGANWRLWIPTDSKRALYTPEMEYWLEQWEELRGRISGRRIDYQACKQTRKIDLITGVDGLFGFRKNRPTDAQIQRLLAPPETLVDWARAAAATTLPPGSAEIPLAGLEVAYPAVKGQRMASRFLLTIPAGAPLTPFVEGEKSELRLAVLGRLERRGETFEEFQLRFVLPPPASEVPIALAIERSLRPGEEFLLRFRLRDEVGGGEVVAARVLSVPRAPQPLTELAVPEEVVVALGEELKRAHIPGPDHLLLFPPTSDVVFGLWRAEALVSGERIVKVAFFLDGKLQLARGAPPWTAELRLPNLPVEWVVRADGLDARGEVVASDEVVLNQPQGEPRVRILAPERGAQLSGTTLARAGVVVPEGRRVERVEFRVNDQVVATRKQPPWESEIEVPAGGELAYLTVVAFFTDDSQVEDVRFLNAPQFLEEVEVNLVELYVTVLDRGERPVDGLTEDDFEVLDAGTRQRLARFEQVQGLALTLSLVLDTSGSMRDSMAEAKKAAVRFLESVVTPRDRCFAVGFADRPALLMPPTSDVPSLEVAFADLPATGMTALHDALVFSLHYFRGVRGRKAMVLLSDGDDTVSAVPFRDALEYARRSGVVIYPVGLAIPRTSMGIRGKLKQLAEETGGRHFFIDQAAELEGVYEEIELELRSQYFLAFAPDPPPVAGEFRPVEVKVQGGKLRARTSRGYFP